MASPGNLSLMLNIDWFNPFEETQYSVGAIYLAIQNLPRSERFKVDNIILVGLIPGPTEPSKHMNTYLSLLVDELNELYEGVLINNPFSLLGKSHVRAVLSCIVCDLPATRKVCGFLGLNALKGCSKCLKEFPTASFGSKPDYSGYNWESWPPRNLQEHIEKSKDAKKAATATARSQIESRHGLRYSELIRLSYFDVIRYHVVDPMHNLFLGLAKHTIKTWKELNILRDLHFEILQEKVDSINPPPRIGRIPRKIASGFSAFTADEWKHWILIYSLHSLKNVIPSQDYQCWCLFVDACTILCQLVITKEDAELAHDLIVKFCKNFKELYGSNYCTPNMHMACHIKDCVLDYGPLSAFWAFSFERFNGTLERTKKSWCGPEKQMLSKFLDLQSLNTMGLSENSPLLQHIYSDIFGSQHSTSFSSVNQMLFDTSFLMDQSRYYNCKCEEIDATMHEYHKFVPPLRRKCFNDIDVENISEMYKVLYPNSEIIPARFYTESKEMFINGEYFISNESRSKRSPAILCQWAGVIGIDTSGEAPVRVGVVFAFIEHSVTEKIQASVTTHKIVLARVKWLQYHPHQFFFHPSSIIVSATLFDQEGPASFVPVSRIISRCALSDSFMYHFDYGEDRIRVAMPLLKSIHY